MAIVSRNLVRPLAANAVVALLLTSCTANTPATAPLKAHPSSGAATTGSGTARGANSAPAGGATTTGKVAISRSGHRLAVALGSGSGSGDAWTVTTLTTTGTAPRELIVQHVAQETTGTRSPARTVHLRLPQTQTVATFTPTSFAKASAAWSGFDQQALLRDRAASTPAAPVGAPVPAALTGVVDATSAATANLGASQARVTAAARQLTAVQQEAAAAVSSLATSSASSSPTSSAGRTGPQGAALGSIAALQGSVASVRGAILALQGSVTALLAATANAERVAGTLTPPSALPTSTTWASTALAVQQAEAIAAQAATAAQQARGRGEALQARVRTAAG